MVIMANRKHGNTPLKVGLYDIGEEIGKGNFATVRFARHRHTKSDVSTLLLISTSLAYRLTLSSASLLLYSPFTSTTKARV